VNIPFYGGSTAYAQPPISPMATPQARATNFPHGSGNFVQMTGLGQASGQLSPRMTSAIVLAGAAAGGASVGFVASGDKEGALRGAGMSAGLAGINDAVNHWRLGGDENKMMAAVLGVAGAVSLGFAIRRMQQKRRWR
jgi:hypothetical protein